MTKFAYHLRQDGMYFPVTAHIYCSGDGTLMGEAEAAEFIIDTKTDGEHLAKRVLDTWMGIMICKSCPMAPDNLEVSRFIIPAISNSQSLLEYRLSDEEMLAIHEECNYYHTMGELRTYLDNVDISALQTDIMTLLEQEFCRVRYGGIYDSHGEPELWFRISSVGVSWDDTIRSFVNKYRNIQKVKRITICRDRNAPEDPKGDYVCTDKDFKVYKRNDGVLYLHMPLNEYFFTTSDKFDKLLVLFDAELSKWRDRTLNNYNYNGDSDLLIRDICQLMRNLFDTSPDVMDDLITPRDPKETEKLIRDLCEYYQITRNEADVKSLGLSVQKRWILKKEGGECTLLVDLTDNGYFILTWEKLSYRITVPVQKVYVYNRQALAAELQRWLNFDSLKY